MSSERGGALDGEISFEELLGSVERPFRYIGGEWNEIVKDPQGVELRLALAFPDVYEIGMSHLGYRILYPWINARQDAAAERVFCPWPDMAGALRRHRRPLCTLETGTPLARFDVVGFSLQYEMTYTNVLEMLDLGGIPLRAAERGEADPLVIAGGPVVFNAEPLADFLDLVLVGDGEALVPQFLDRLKVLKRSRATRLERIRDLATIEGVYAPSLYDTEEEHGLLIPFPRGSANYPVRRRILMDLDVHPFPDRIVVPHGEIVHDRVSVEIMRGCPVGCRFCQAGYVYRPTRERDPNQVRDTVIRSIRATGYDAFSLASLNSGEYGAIHPLLADLMDRFEPESVSVSLSSLHASTMTPELAAQVRRVRKSGFTIAPEAGTQRLRNVINKNLTEEQILEACRLAFEAGWDLIKLYFMIGLPTETDADIDALVDLAHGIQAAGRKSGRGRRVGVTVSASSFVPKPVTPFQWLGMDRLVSLHRKQDRIAARLKRGLTFKRHDCETTYLEAVLSRGDRRLSAVLESAWRAGARFDGWGEHFDPSIWRRAFADAGVDSDTYAYREVDPSWRLPWDVIDARVNKKWLALDLQRALRGEALSTCGPTDCHGCGPFARDCVQGVVAETTHRPFDASRGVLSTPVAPGPGEATSEEEAPSLPDPVIRGVSGALPIENLRYRYRARYTKGGRLRFLGHLDLTRTLLRGMRRARIPFAYSRGFNPKPRVSFGPALAVGVESEAEYLDFETVARLEPEATLAAINGAMPRGLRFDALREIPASVPGLGEAVRAARYRVHAGGGFDPADAVAAFRSRGPITILREKDGRVRRLTLDPASLEMETREAGTIGVVLSVGGESAAVRPEDVLREIFAERASRMRVVREDLLAEAGGRWVNPLLAAAAVASDAHRAAR